jgi:glycine betaine/proline transport system permease protein
VKWLTREGDWLFDGTKVVILKVLLNLRDGLLWLPWPATITAIGLLAWRLAGWRVSLFSVAALLAIGFIGLWSSAMETLALVTTSVFLAVAIGVPLGVLGARSALADAIMRPVLDGMQTMPSFVYLVPAIMFFSLGNVPAVMATIIYAVPPAIRFTNLGIRQVSPETVEAARAFGATPTQLLLKVQMPLARPTIMAGINQTTMMALAMVVVGALVGAGGLGEDVLRALGRLEPGKALLAGMGIVFMAIIIDRLTQAMAKGQQQAR